MAQLVLVRSGHEISGDDRYARKAEQASRLRDAFRALREPADPIEMRVVPAQVLQRIEFADELLADVDCARVLRLD